VPRRHAAEHRIERPAVKAQRRGCGTGAGGRPTPPRPERR